jgi:hypothetical protein
MRRAVASGPPLPSEALCNMSGDLVVLEGHKSLRIGGLRRDTALRILERGCVGPAIAKGSAHDGAIVGAAPCRRRGRGPTSRHRRSAPCPPQTSALPCLRRFRAPVRFLRARREAEHG